MKEDRHNQKEENRKKNTLVTKKEQRKVKNSLIGLQMNQKKKEKHLKE